MVAQRTEEVANVSLQGTPCLIDRKVFSSRVTAVQPSVAFSEPDQ